MPVDPESLTGLNQNKFHVSRTDGSTEPGGKHALCQFYVLDLEHDRFSRPALRAYADACERDYPDLAADIRFKFLKIK